MLIVPNDLLAHELGGTFLDRQALRVRAAQDAAEALSINAAWLPDLIVARSRLGGESASRFCQAVREARTQKPPRLLLVTDSVGERTGELADAPCDAHLISPLELEHLLSTIAELLELQQRRCPRAALEALVHTEGFASDGAALDVGLGTAVNVGEEGMLLESSRQLEVATMGKVVFFLPGSKERVSLQGVVRAAMDEVRLLFAIEFVDLQPHHRSLIRRFVEGTEQT